MAKAIIQTLSKLPKGAVKTITCDRGSEFANWRQIESELNCDMYFADPYCAWQKGTNENLNGLLREFYPKGKNLERVSPKTLEKNLALINARPKKVLGFKKPVDLFNFFLSKCCTQFDNSLELCGTRAEHLKMDNWRYFYLADKICREKYCE